MRRKRITPKKYSRDKFLINISFPESHKMEEADLPPKKRPTFKSIELHQSSTTEEIETEGEKQKSSSHLPCDGYTSCGDSIFNLESKKADLPPKKRLTFKGIEPHQSSTTEEIETEGEKQKSSSHLSCDGYTSCGDSIFNLESKATEGEESTKSKQEDLKAIVDKFKNVTDMYDEAREKVTGDGSRDDIDIAEEQESGKNEHFNFFLDREDWMEMRPQGTYDDGRRKLSNRWADIFAKEISKFYPGCVLSFSSNKVKKSSSRKKNCVFFRGKASCKRAGCQGKFLFEILCEPTGREQVEVICTGKGQFEHNAELPDRRQLRGKEKERVGREIQKEGSAVKYYLKQVEKAPEDELSKGNLTQCQPPSVIRRVVQDIVNKEILHQNTIQEILLLKQAFEGEDDNNSNTVKGYIQYVGASPFSVAMFSLEQIKLMRCLANQKTLNLYFDATGGVIRSLPYQKRHLLYSLVVKPSDASPPFSVADLLTTGHTIPDLILFLSHIKRAFILTGKDVIVNKIETDWSWSLIQSSLQVFNRMDTKQYLKAAWKIVNYLYDPKDLICVTVLHICCAHMMKDFLQSIRKIDKLSKEVRVFAMKCFSLLQNTHSLISARNIFLSMCHVFGQKFITLEVQSAKKHLGLEIKGLNFEELPGIQESGDARNGGIDTEILSGGDTIKDVSPFTSYFREVYQSSGSQSLKTTTDTNLLHSKEILNLLVEKFLPIYPLWSGVLLGNLQRYDNEVSSNKDVEGSTRDTNSCVEGWFKFLKVDLQGRRRQRAGHFICELRRVTRARLKEIKFPLVRKAIKRERSGTRKRETKISSNRGKQHKSSSDVYRQDIQLAEEQWCKKPRRDSRQLKVLSVKGLRSEKDDITSILPKVPKWGGRIGKPGDEDYVKLVNTCPLDNGFAIVNLAFLENPCFRQHLENEDGEIQENLLACCRLMGDGHFTQAKVIWLSHLYKTTLSGEVNCWGSEWEMFSSQISSLLKSELFTSCDSPDCPRSRKKRSTACTGIHLSIPEDSCGPVSIQSLLDLWIMPPKSQCGSKCPDDHGGMSYKQIITVVDDTGIDIDREQLFCAGTCSSKRVVCNYPPIIVLTLSDLVLTRQMIIDEESLLRNVFIGIEEYRVAGVVYYREGHFIAVLCSEIHGWLSYDGLYGKAKSFKSNDITGATIESVYLVKITRLGV